MTLASRRNFAWMLFGGATVFVWLLNDSLRVHLRRAEIFSGLTLFGVVLLLTLFNARKKLPFLPILRASTWMQIHIYVGLLSCVLFVLHAGWRFPQGRLEGGLAVLFYLVSISGVVGLALSRWLPSQLTVAGENVMFERIPALQAAVRRDVQDLVLEAVAKSKSSTVADFYELKLQPYFARSRNRWFHVLGSGKPLHNLLAEVQALDRYLKPEERDIMARIVENIHAKNNLDYQLARQGLLKGWLFVHIPLTYSMILVASVHGLLAWELS